MVVDNPKRQALADMEEISGSIGTLEQKAIDKKEEFLVGKWV